MPRQKPIDRRALIHKAEWSPKRLVDNDPKTYILDKVRITTGFVFFATGDQQSSYGNYKLYFDCRLSTVDGVEEQCPEFAVGDTIKMINGPINNYPNLLKVINVWQFTDTSPEHVHHVELLLR